jgi:hypothetical protein
MPGCQAVVAEAADGLGYVPGNGPSGAVRDGFCAMLRQLFEETLPVLEAHEKRCYRAQILADLRRRRPDLQKELEQILIEKGGWAMLDFVLDDCYPSLRSWFAGMFQSRKVRGGKDFEAQVELLLELAGIRFERQVPRSRVDLVLPTYRFLKQHPAQAVVASLKRTLRERWRFGLDELAALHCPNAFVLTADPEPPPNAVAGITGQRIQLVVWDNVKAERLMDNPFVFGYTAWINERLPALEQFWQGSGDEE